MIVFEDVFLPYPEVEEVRKNPFTEEHVKESIAKSNTEEERFFNMLLRVLTAAGNTMHVLATYLSA